MEVLLFLVGGLFNLYQFNKKLGPSNSRGNIAAFIAGLVMYGGILNIVYLLLG
jgi:hypothetical protein